MARDGRTTVYNDITSKEKLKEVNEENLQLEEDFIEYLKAEYKKAYNLDAKIYVVNAAEGARILKAF